MLTLKLSVCILLKGFRKTSQCQLPTLLTCDLRLECIASKLDISMHLQLLYMHFNVCQYYSHDK